MVLSFSPVLALAVAVGAHTQAAGGGGPPDRYNGSFQPDHTRVPPCVAWMCSLKNFAHAQQRCVQQPPCVEKHSDGQVALAADVVFLAVPRCASTSSFSLMRRLALVHGLLIAEGASCLPRMNHGVH